MIAIEARGLVKRFGPLTAVDGVSFEVKTGEFFGFLGPNGAGKTTTIHMLSTLLRPTSGSVKVNGYDCLAEPHRVRSSIGLVFQETTLDKDLTVYENLLFTCYLYRMTPSRAGERIEEILHIMDLADRRNDLVKTLSGGLRRRLDIARGLLHRPRILFLDEPTLGLDPHARVATWALIDRLRELEELTIFLTTHYLDEAERCDRIGIIDRGKLIALGSPSELKEMIPWESVNITRPSLNDVFIHLTGRGIR